MLNSEWKENPQLLIEEFRSRNKEAFHHIYDLFHATLRNFAARLLNNPEEAEDIVAESFIKVWERCHTFNTVDGVRAFLFTITRNACIDFLKHSHRKEASHKQILEMSQQDEEAYLQANMLKAELLEKVLSHVKNMPDGMKQIFLMAYIDGMSTADIAKQLNLAEDTVRVQKSRAVKLLKKILGDKGLLVGGILSPALLALLKEILHL